MRASIISKPDLSNFIQLKLPKIRPAVSGSDVAYNANDSKAIIHFVYSTLNPTFLSVEARCKVIRTERHLWGLGKSSKTWLKTEAPKFPLGPKETAHAPQSNNRRWRHRRFKRRYLLELDGLAGAGTRTSCQNF